MAASPKSKRLSSSGTVFVGGMISLEEYNRKLIGRLGLDIYDEMRRADGSTSAALRIVKLPIMSANWKIQPASDQQQDKDIADKVQHNLDYIGWKQVLREILLLFDFGFSVFEKVMDVIPSEYGDYIGISEFGSLKQRTVFKWQLPNGAPGIVQLPPTGGEVSLPAEKIIIFTNEREGDNYEGRSLLRPAYKHWYIKEQIYKIDALGLEKQGLGIPNLEIPDGASPTDKETAREIARNIRANEAAFSEMPEGFKLSFLDMMARTVRDPMNSINHHTTQILKSILAQFLELGSAGAKSGSNALSTDQSELFMKSEEYAADYVAEQINRHFIPDIVKANYPNAQTMPKLVYSDLSDSNTHTLSESIQRLMTSGAITADPDLEEHLRDVYDLPNLPDEYRKDYANRPMNKVQPAPTTTASLRDAIRSLDKYIEASINETSRSRKTKR